MDLTRLLQVVGNATYTCSESEDLFRSNSQGNLLPKNFENVQFVSSAYVHTNQKFRNKGKWPVQGSDFAIYMATGENKPLGIISFTVTNQNYLMIDQIQGTKFDDLQGWERTVLVAMPWEKALLEVVEQIAKKSKAAGVKVVSAQSLPEVKKDPSLWEKLSLRYDIPALERGYDFNEKQEIWYKFSSH